MHGLPDLPKWINLVFNQNLKLGFLYGTPPNSLASIRVIIFNFIIAIVFIFKSLNNQVAHSVAALKQGCFTGLF
jgi:hypothetical protein